jgi:hypothetical protein
MFCFYHHILHRWISRLHRHWIPNLWCKEKLPLHRGEPSSKLIRLLGKTVFKMVLDLEELIRRWACDQACSRIYNISLGRWHSHKTLDVVTTYCPTDGVHSSSNVYWWSHRPLYSCHMTDDRTSRLQLTHLGQLPTIAQPKSYTHLGLLITTWHPCPQKLALNFADKWRLLSRNSSLAD